MTVMLMHGYQLIIVLFSQLYVIQYGVFCFHNVYVSHHSVCDLSLKFHSRPPLFGVHSRPNPGGQKLIICSLQTLFKCMRCSDEATCYSSVQSPGYQRMLKKPPLSYVSWLMVMPQTSFPLDEENHKRRSVYAGGGKKSL